MNGDLYLRATVGMKESPAPPSSGAVVETLLRLAHNMPEQPFVWGFIDKPRAGSSAIVYNDPSRPWPSDGIRYAQNIEQISTTTQTFSRNPGSVELETYVVTQGIYPPANSAVPLAQDTPELNLARFRIRFRIAGAAAGGGLGNPGLWYVYWGRDDRVQVRAPPGWEREAIRRYPLPLINESVQYPLRRQNGYGPGGLPQPAEQPQQNNGGGPGMMPQPQSMGLAQSRPRSAVQQQQQQQQPGRPNMPMPMPMQIPMPGPLQQNMQQPPPNMQQMQQQQQQQQQYASQIPQPTKQLQRKVQTPNGGPQASLPVVMQQQQPPQGPTQAQIQQFQQQSMAQARTMLSTLTFPAAFNDPYELLSDRSWAGLRYERNHALIAPIFDACTVDEILTSWKAPSLPDIADIRAQIAETEAEVEKLRAAMAKSSAEVPPSSNQSSASLARKGSVIPAASHADTQTDPLLAPLPRMMSIAEMSEGAMQAHNARRKEAEQIAAAAEAEQMLVREEEERVRREEEGRLEQEERERRRVQEAQEEEAAQRQRDEEEKIRMQREQEQEQEQEQMRLQAQQGAQQQQQQLAQQPSQQNFQQYQANNGHQTQQAQQQEQPQYEQLGDMHFGQEEHATHANQHDFMDDAYLYANNLGSYGVGAGGDGEGDGMEESLFDEYFNQTAGM